MTTKGPSIHIVGTYFQKLIEKLGSIGVSVLQNTDLRLGEQVTHAVLVYDHF